jgi:hypothetical protein
LPQLLRSKKAEIPVYDCKNPRSVEKYSSAVTLSDMEVFIFPELMYSLMLANIMSPRIWKWREDSWFAGKMPVKNELRRMQRLKQYIMDRFAFNLDLNTWGLTTKERELARFAEFIDESILARSNALFGYEGDKYYFDIDIRRHFGLDKYTSNVIPYWKTETLEAMEAFRYKEGYNGGAGECVSLAALYASAAFAIADIPLDKIFLLATPLHSQNFLDIGEGIITNNRRIVTKNMWYNGTELSAKARRALENEKVTIVAHNTGCVHTLYPAASINKDFYGRMKDKLTKFLSTNITYEILANFLRHNNSLQKHFQISHTRHGKILYMEAERVYSYEHSSKLRVGDETQANLLQDIDSDEFFIEPRENRFDMGRLEEFFKDNRIDIDSDDDINKLKIQFANGPVSTSYITSELIKFCRIIPKMPDDGKDWSNPEPIRLDGVKSAEEAREALLSQRHIETVDLAFMAFRDLSTSPWKPFLKAAIERNPVCVTDTGGLSIDEAYRCLTSSLFVDESIYDEPTRLAQPDEVWNYKRGDGLEKAIALASIYINRHHENTVTIDTCDGNVKLTCGNDDFLFNTGKNIAHPEAIDWP